MTVTPCRPRNLEDALREETDPTAIGREFAGAVQELVEETRAEARAAGRQYRLIHRLWQLQEEAREQRWAVEAAWMPRETEEQRHRLAHADRRVWTEPREDGMAQLSALLDAATAHAIQDRIEALAGRTDPEGWTAPQLRADVLADLLLDGEPADLPEHCGASAGT